MKRATAEDVKKVALAALATALDDGKEEVRKKPGLTGMRAVATGAVLYTGARAAISGRRFVRSHFGPSQEEDHAEDADERDDDHYDSDAEAEADEDVEGEDEDDEPRAEEDEDFEDEDEDDEPRAEEDEDFEDEDEDDEPRAEDDEDFEDEDDDERVESPSDRPPVHGEGDGDEASDPDLPDRPSRRRKPVATS